MVHLLHTGAGSWRPVLDALLAVEVVIVAEVVVITPDGSEAQAVVLQVGIVADADHGRDEDQDEESQRSCPRVS